jgi:hypothetical protein
VGEVQTDNEMREVLGMMIRMKFPFEMPVCVLYLSLTSVGFRIFELFFHKTFCVMETILRPIVSVDVFTACGTDKRTNCFHSVT